jgi:hypothetical protein
MFTEIRKSIENILNERIYSPFYGSFTVSWLIWNWKIIYLTLFISEKSIKGSKISFIETNYSDINILFTYPLLSTLFIILIMPFITNGAYWISLLFSKWKTDKKNEIEQKQFLTLEQSIQIREELRNLEERYEKLVLSKENEIDLLKQQLSTIETNLYSSDKKTNKLVNYEDEFNQVLDNPRLMNDFDGIISRIQGGYKLSTSSGPSKDSIGYFESHDFITPAPSGGGTYILTQKGKAFYKKYSDQKFNK